MVEFSNWTVNKRKLKNLSQLKEDIIKNLKDNNLEDEKIVCMLSGGKDSSISLAICKELNLNVSLGVHFVHKWSWDISKKNVEYLKKKYNIPIIYHDITDDLKKRLNGAKGGSVCRICKNIMKDNIVKIAKKNDCKIIMTGDTALEKISGPIMDYLREMYGEVIYSKMELTKVPKKYNTFFLRPLIRCGYEDILKLKDYYGIDITQVNEVGDKIGYWREGCPIQYCDYNTIISNEELLDKLYLYNLKLTEIGRKYGFRCSIKLPSKEIMVVPKKDEYIKMCKEVIDKLEKDVG